MSFVLIFEKMSFLSEKLPEAKADFSVENVKEALGNCLVLAREKFKEMVYKACTGEISDAEVNAYGYNLHKRIDTAGHEAGHALCDSLSSLREPYKIFVSRVPRDIRKALAPFLKITGGSVRSRLDISDKDVWYLVLPETGFAIDASEEPEEATKARVHLIISGLAGIAAEQTQVRAFESRNANALFEEGSEAKWGDIKWPLNLVAGFFGQDFNPDDEHVQRSTYLLYCDIAQFIHKNRDVLDIIQDFILENSPLIGPGISDELSSYIADRGYTPEKWEELSQDYENLESRCYELLITLRDTARMLKDHVVFAADDDPRPAELPLAV